MSVDRRTKRTRAAAAMALLTFVWSVAGCGGSGSSGFDVSQLSESATIARAIDTGECVDFNAKAYCASGAEAKTSAIQGAAVIIQEPSSPLECDGHETNDPNQQCTASLEFATVGFEKPSSFLAAVSDSEKGPWTLVPLTVSDDVTAPRTVSITVPASPEAPPAHIIAAVLVYVDRVPDGLPQTSARLADFGADLMYVSSRLKIVVPQ
jgi:hypothetical protein